MQKHIVLTCMWAYSLFSSESSDIVKNVSIFSRAGSSLAGIFLARANPLMSAKTFIFPNSLAHVIGIYEHFFGKNKTSNMLSSGSSATSIAGGVFFFAATTNPWLRAFIASSTLQNSTLL